MDSPGLPGDLAAEDLADSAARRGGHRRGIRPHALAVRHRFPYFLDEGTYAVFAYDGSRVAIDGLFSSLLDRPRAADVLAGIPS